ncbi:PepSY domain-containing protein [Pasteurellaceae bacterium 22721_9_1]
MKRSVKTFAATLLAGVVAFGAMSTVNAMSPKEQEALSKAQITAVQALSTAQAKIGSDAKVKEIEFKHSFYGKDYFQVEMFANGQKHEVDVDATNGEILAVESKTPKKVKQHADIVPKVTFTQAIETAIAKTGGKVAEADFKNKHGKSYYKIETINNGQEFVVTIDADNGQLIDLPKKEKKDKHHKKHEHREGYVNTDTVEGKTN